MATLTPKTIMMKIMMIMRTTKMKKISANPHILFVLCLFVLAV
jgi:hypothetical protein